MTTKSITQQLICTRDGMTWGEYLVAGEIYEVQVPLNLKGDVYFRGPQGSTFMRFDQYRRAVVNGWLLPAREG